MTPPISTDLSQPYRPLPSLLEGLLTCPNSPGGPTKSSRPSWWDCLPLPTLWQGLPTPPGSLEGPPGHSRRSGRAYQILPPLLVGLPTTPNLSRPS